jgi:hypothetical protein
MDPSDRYRLRTVARKCALYAGSITLAAMAAVGLLAIVFENADAIGAVIMTILSLGGHFWGFVTVYCLAFAAVCWAHVMSVVMRRADSSQLAVTLLLVRFFGWIVLFACETAAMLFLARLDEFNGYQVIACLSMFLGTAVAAAALVSPWVLTAAMDNAQG